MQPTINSFDTQRWFELGDDTFEKFCCDLHAVQYGIATCQLHGIRGQCEFGVDHIAQTIDGSYIEVGQSKCYADFKEEDIKKAVKPFIEHIGKWKERNVKRFILFVACDIQRTQVHDEVVIQKKLFADEGIIFEFWAGRDIQRKLQPHRTIVEKYVDSKEIVDVVCGSPQKDANVATEYHDQLDLNAISSQRDLLANLVSETKSKELERFRDYYRQGRHREAYEGVNALADRTDARWNLLDTSTRGSILRILALYTIYLENDLNKAENLAEEAGRVDITGDDTVMRTMLAYHRNGHDKALEIVQGLNNIDAIHLHSSFLLEMQKVDETLRLLDNLPKGITTNAETNRLHAIAFLLKGDIVNAKEKINAAIKEKPEWLSVRVSNAIINYWSAISTCILTKIKPLVPLPISFELVKRDENSLALLRETAKEFQSLLTDQLEDHEQYRLKLWNLASLAVNPDRQSQEEAEAFCKKMLSEDAGNPIPLRWAMSRNYDIDYKLSEDALEKACETDFDYIGRVLVFIDLKIALNKKDEALIVLEKNENIFRANDYYDYWLFQQAHSFSIDQKWAEAEKIAEKIADPSMRNQAKANILRDQYDHTGNWQPLLARLELLFESTGDGLSLLEACRIKMDLGEYTYVLEHSDTLLSTVATPIALSLIAECAFKDKQFSKCLKLIDSHTYLFERKNLTPQLRFYRIQCLIQLGYLNSAYEDAKTLAADGTSAGLLALMNVQYHNGDLDGYTVNARLVLSYNDVLPTNLLKVAEVSLLKDRELAIVLWRKAVAIGINDPDIVSIAVSLGYKLALDKEMGAIVRKMSEFAARGQGSVKAITIPELLEMQKVWSHDQLVISDNYRKGNIPVHLLPKMAGASMVNLYHGYLTSCRSEPNPLYQSPVYCLHGSRVPNSYKGIRALYIDITALLLAADIGILDAVEKAFNKLYIPARTIFLLQEEHRKLIPIQPERIGNMKKILSLKKLNALSTIRTSPSRTESTDPLAKAMGAKWMKIFENAINSSGYVVDYMPLTSNDLNHVPMEVPTDRSSYIIGQKELIQALKSFGAIDDNEAAESFNKLGSTVCYEEKTQPLQAGSKLYLVGNMPETLAECGVLEVLCQNFSVFVEQEEIERIDKELTDYKQQEKLCLWTQQLIDRIKNNLNIGIYETIKRDTDFKELDSHPENTLSEIFAIRSDAALWSDDRFINSFSNMNGAPILGITDILSLLKSRKKISKDACFEKLLQLRASNVRFIPLSKQEILYHLKRTKLEEGQIIETKELSIIRAYWAASILDTGLQCPPKPGSDKHEINYLIKSKRAIEESIIAGWEDKAIDNDLASARADWILQNLYTGIFGIRHLMHDPDPMSDRIDIIGLDIASLLSLPIGLLHSEIKEKTSEATPVKRYLEWLCSRIIDARLNADPEVIPAVVAFIKNIVSISQQKLAEEDNVERVLLQKLIIQFPRQLKNEFNNDAKLMRWLGLETYDAVNIGNITFRASDFWRAVYNSLKGEKQTISPYRAKNKFFVESAMSDENDNITIIITDDKHNIIDEKDDPLFHILSDDAERRLNALIQNRKWFECSNEEIHNIHREISDIADPIKRVEYVIASRLNSPAYYYTVVESKLQSPSGSMTLSDFIPPSKENYFKHYCLSINDFSSLDLNNAIKTVMEREAMEEALTRILTIPCKLPVSELSRLSAMEVKSRNELLLSLEYRVHSPVSLLQLIDILLYFADGSNDLLLLAKRAFDRLGNDSYREHEFKLFVAILRHCEAELSNWKECRDWPVAAKIFYLWTHASRLLNILISARADTDKLCNWLENRIMNQYIFNFDYSYRHDILNPLNVTVSSFICHGIAVILNQHKAEHIEYLKVAEYITEFVDAGKEGKSRAFVDGVQNPALQLNSLNSFLGGDRYEILKPIVGDEIANLFSTPSLQSYVQNSIANLSRNIASMPDWFLLMGILKDMPLWRDTKDDLAQLLEKVELLSLYNTDARGTTILLPSICEQVCSQKNEELRNRILDGIAELARIIDKEVDARSLPNFKETASFFIEAAFRLSIYEGDSRRVSKYFAMLMEKIIYVSNKIAIEIRPIIWSVLTNLTADQIHGIWRLMLLSRAVT